VLPRDLVQSALEYAPDATVITDGAGRIVFTNQQVAALFGYTPEELAGGSIEQLLPERFRVRHIAHRNAFTVHPRVRPMGAGLELYGRRKDGSEFPVEISLSPIRRGTETLTAAAIRDITDRKRIEGELIAAREEAKRANVAKSRFLATASHDLRQPLQALALLNGALRRIGTDRDVNEALIHQENAITAMSRLVNALLDISKLESGAIKPEVTDFTVAALFEELHQEFAGLAGAKGLTLQVESCEDDVVRSDRSLIEQVLRNLLANAIKYTREGFVALRCFHEAAILRLEVLDTGAGIPADQLPHIFEEFYQVGVAQNQSSNGYGLGLSIVSRIVRLLDLKLDVRSEPGKGSTFSLELPAGSAYGRPRLGETARRTSPTDRAQGRRRRVLLVEDDRGVRDATRLLLKAEGYEVVTAASPAEALAKADEFGPPDLLITDYHLDDAQSGVDVIRSLRLKLGSELTAILVSGDTSPAVTGLLLDEHMRLASKPIQAEQLLGVMTELLGDLKGAMA
jgi:two-component system, sensor histidine kinase